MNSFCRKFYRKIGNEKMKLQDQIQQCEEETKLMYKDNTFLKDMRVQLFSQSYGTNSSNNHISNNSTSVQFQEGKVCDISLTRCNFDYYLNKSPFVTRETNIMKTLCLSLIFNDYQQNKQQQLKRQALKNLDQGQFNQQKYLNIYGSKGVGKTRLVT